MSDLTPPDAPVAAPPVLSPEAAPVCLADSKAGSPRRHARKAEPTDRTEGISEALEEAIEAIPAKPSATPGHGVILGLADGIGELVGPAVEGTGHLLAALGEGLGGLAEGIGEGLGAVLEGLGDLFSGL